MDKLNQFGFSDKNFASQKGHTKPQPTQPGYGQRTHTPSQPLKQQTGYGGKPSGYGQRPQSPVVKKPQTPGYGGPKPGYGSPGPKPGYGGPKPGYGSPGAKPGYGGPKQP